jgi:tape measure domain-containing protein
MANEVKLKLAIDGVPAVVTDLNRVGAGLGRLDEQARAASGGADTLKTALAGMATVGTALAAIRMADAVTTLQTSLKLASGSAAEATVAYEKLFAIAQQSRVSFTELGATYATIARSSQSLGISQDRLLTVTQAVGNAMTIGGGQAQSMQAALVQLGQGLASGTLRGEELNSIMEQTPRLAKALADGMGVPLGQLRALGEQGKLTSEMVVKALEKSAPQLAREMSSATVTVGQAFTMLSNSTLKFVGEADSASGASGNLAGALQATAGAIDTVGSAINNNQAAFGVITGGLAGAATLTGVVALTGGIRALWLAVMAGSATNPVILGLMALGAAGGAAVAAAGAFKGSVTMMKADAAHLKNSIDAIARDLPKGTDDESVKERAAAALKTQRLTAMRTDLVQRLALMDADTAANASFNNKEAKMLAERTAAQNTAFSGAKPLDEVRKMTKLRTDVLQQGNDEAVALAKSFGAAMAKATPEEAVKLQTEMGVRMIASAKETAAAMKSFDSQGDSGAKAAAARVLAVAKGLAVYNDVIAKSNGLGADFSEKWAALNLAYTTGAISVGQLTQAQAALLAQQTFAKDATKAQEEQTRALAKAQEEAAKQTTQYYDGLARGLMVLADSNQKLREQVEEIGLTSGALETLRLARLDATIAQEQEIMTMASAHEASTAELLVMQKRIDLLKEERQLKGQGAAKEAGIEAAKKVNAEWQKGWEETDRIARDAFTGWAENGTSMAETIGKSLKKALLSAIYEATIRPLAMNIYSSATGAMGVAGAGGGSAGGVGGWLNGASNSYSLYGAATSGYSLGSQYLAGTMSGANAMGTVAANAGYAGGGIDGLLATNGAYGTSAGASGASAGASAGALGYVGAGLAGISVGTAIAGDKTVMGVDGTSMAAVGAAIGSYFGPWGTLAGGIIGGVVNAAFGEGEQKHDPTRLTGSFSGDSFSGANKTRWNKEGGWFSSGSSGEDVIGISKAQSDALGLVTKGVQSVFDKLLLTSDKAKKSIVGWTFAIDRQVSSAEQQKQLTLDMAESMGNYLIPSLAKFKAEGESLADTAVRMTDQFLLTDRVASLLGKDLSTAFGAMGIASMAARDELVKMMGGIQVMTGSVQAYYATYFTNNERLANDAKALGEQFDSLGLTMPRTKDGLRELVEGMDLSTTAGRATAAALIALSPQFATIADGLAALAKETATQLMATFTAGGQLLPALAAAQLKVGDFTGGVQVLTGDLSFINKIMGDASSGVISFGSGVVQLDTGLSDSQRSAGLLTDQIEALRERADKARIDFAGLGVALLGVDTATFVNTIGLVFDNLASRISGVIAGISAERVAVREAAISIIGPQVMSRTSIAAEIAAIRVGSGSGALNAAGRGVSSADAALAASDTRIANNAKALEAAKAGQALLSAGVAAAAANMAADVTKFQGLSGRFHQIAANYAVAKHSSNGGDAYAYNASTNRFSDWGGAATSTSNNGRSYNDFTWDNAYANQAIGKEGLEAKLNSANRTLLLDERKIAAAKLALSSGSSAANVAYAAAVKEGSAALAARTILEASSKAALLAYTAAQQAYIVEASKSVPRLTKLREETLKYYEAQKQLAGLMTTSAAGIRGTISAYTFSQKTDEQKYQDLAGQFSSAYTMSKITTGETLAGYGDKINALINPMIEALTATGRDGLIASYLAQAEAAAVSIDKGVVSLGDYQADSLGLLGSIDSVLAELDDGTQAVARAIKAGSDATLNGLAAIVSAITREAAPSTSSWGGPAFASGGAFTNGVVSRPTMFDMGQMGEAGSEGILPLANIGGRLGVHARMGGGSNTARLEALVERQAQQLEAITRELVALRREAAATASSNEKMAKQGDRYEVIGMPVRNAQGQSFETVVAA